MAQLTLSSLWRALGLVLLESVCQTSSLETAHSNELWASTGSGSSPATERVLLSENPNADRRKFIRAEMAIVELPGQSTSSRLASEVKRSAARARIFHEGRVSHQGSEGSTYSMQSSVAPVPGGYAMKIYLGSPMQMFSVLVDTGSDLVWIQCNPCTECIDQPNTPFDPSVSTTYSPLPCAYSMCQQLPHQACGSNPYCHYEYGYGDQSTTSGDLAAETITLTDVANGQSELQAITGFTFGCGYDNEGTFDGVDGLVGLGMGPLSFPSQLAQELGNIFSYCLVSFADASDISSPISFGDSGLSGLQYTPIATNGAISTFYYVYLEDISVNNEHLNIPQGSFAPDENGNGGTIFDSGTTITQLPSTAYQALKQAIESYFVFPPVSRSNVGLDLCFQFPDPDMLLESFFPAVTFNFRNADFRLPARNSFVIVDGLVCLAMASSSFDLSIFGNFQQQNFQIVYDRETFQIGFASAQCDNLHS